MDDVGTRHIESEKCKCFEERRHWFCLVMRFRKTLPAIFFEVAAVALLRPLTVGLSGIIAFRSLHLSSVIQRCLFSSGILQELFVIHFPHNEGVETFLPERHGIFNYTLEGLIDA